LSKALSTLSHKSETVAENGETTAKFGDCRTFLRQCGQAIRKPDLRPDFKQVLSKTKVIEFERQWTLGPKQLILESTLC